MRTEITSILEDCCAEWREYLAKVSGYGWIGFSFAIKSYKDGKSRVLLIDPVFIDRERTSEKVLVRIEKKGELEIRESQILALAT